MTRTEEARSSLALRSRCGPELLLDQLQGIEAWTRAHSLRAVDVAAAGSREAALDLARRRDVLARQRQALLDWTEGRLRDGDDVLRSSVTRVVLAHRHAWFKGKLAAGLQAGGVEVVADLENGADAVGVVVAEQPDFLVVEDKLPMISGLELARAAARYAPSTLVVVQTANDWEIGPFLDAGAATVYTRRTPPADIAADLLAAVAG